MNELAVLWNLSKQTIRRLFQDEPDVVRIGENDVRRKRAYVTLRIPESVARQSPPAAIKVRLSKSGSTLLDHRRGRAHWTCSGCLVAPARGSRTPQLRLTAAVSCCWRALQNGA